MNLLITIFTLGFIGEVVSEKCNNFCCQTPETARICEENRHFLKSKAYKQNDFEKYDLTDIKCKKCVDRAILSTQNLSKPIQQYMMFNKKLECELSHECKLKLSSKKLIGSNRCTWGPSMTCSSMDIASECNAFQHCSQLWMKKRLISRSSHTDVCLACQKTLSNIHFKGDSLQLVKDNCGEFSQCSYNIQKYLTQLITLRNITNGGVSPAVLCNKLGMCEGTPVDYQLDDYECTMGHAIWIRARQLSKGTYRQVLEHLLTECNHETRCEQAVLHFFPTFLSNYGEYLSADRPETGEIPCIHLHVCSPSSNPVFCNLCMTVTIYMKKMLENNRTVEAARSSMKVICNLLGPRQQECEQYVDEHIENWLIDVETNVNPSKICKDLNLCKPNETIDHIVETAVCDKCESIVNRIRGRSICHVKKFFNFFISSFCRFTGPLETKCILFVHNIKDDMIVLIESILRTDVICKQFCKKQSLHGEFTLELLSDTLAKDICFNDHNCHNSTSFVFTKLLKWLDSNEGCDEPASSHPSTGSMCKACKLFEADDLKILMWKAGNSSRQIIDGMKSICSFETNKSQELQCYLFVQDFSSRISRVLPLLKQNEYDLFCDKLGVCQKEDRCMMCALISKELVKILPRDEDITEATAIHAFSQACHQIDSYVPIKQCLAFVDNFQKTMTALIVNKHTSPKTLCSTMGVCYIPEKGKLTMSTCEICRFMVEAAERAIATNTTTDSIIHFVEKACGQLPASYRSKCDALVEKNLPKIIEMLNLFVQPEIVCMKLGLCFVNDEQSLIEKFSFCSLCQISAITLRAWVESSQIIDNLTNFMNATCNTIFSSDSRQDCIDATSSITRLLMHWLSHEDPLHICRIAHFCPLANNSRAFTGI